MKKLILFLLVSFLFTAYSASAKKLVIGTPGGNGEGGVIVHGKWPAGDTVIVYDYMTIPVGDSLTIEPGVTVYFADTVLKIELICLGNFYSLGTKENPVTITTIPSLVPKNIPTADPFPSLWGSIVCDTTCSEFLMLYTNISYFGGPTLNNSPSVLLNLYKDAAGETEPAVDFRDHNGGKLVIEHCTIHNGVDDGIYVEGGNFIYSYNTLYQNGFSGGDATNIKAGTIADLGFNFYYSPNTNGLKLSNSGSRSPQTNVVGYNNTIVNAGWRRPTVKGGGIWYEEAVVAHCYNNLQINDRFGLKENESPDPSCTADYNYYYGYTQDCVNGFTTAVGLFPAGTHDIRGAFAGDKNPLVVNYPLATDTMNSIYNPSWDFRLQTNSPAVGTGTTNFTRHFGTPATGLTILGVTYTSPNPSDTIGAFGTVIPVKSIAVSSKALTVGVGDTKTISATVAPANADTLTYTWTSLDPTIATVDQNGNVKGIKIGMTKIYAKTTDRGYSDTATVTVISSAGIQVIKDDAKFNIFPNPVKSELKLQFTSVSEHSTISVYSSMGQLVLNKTFETVGLNNLSLSVDNLANGIYAITIQNDNIVMTKKFVKE